MRLGSKYMIDCISTRIDRQADSQGDRQAGRQDRWTDIQTAMQINGASLSPGNERCLSSLPFLFLIIQTDKVAFVASF